MSIPASEGQSSPDEDSIASSLEVGGVAGEKLSSGSRTSRHVSLSHGSQPAATKATKLCVADSFNQSLRGPKPTEMRQPKRSASYRSQRSEFPSECSEIAHAERIKTAFPIHSEVFDRLTRNGLPSNGSNALVAYFA